MFGPPEGSGECVARAALSTEQARRSGAQGMKSGARGTGRSAFSAAAMTIRWPTTPLGGELGSGLGFGESPADALRQRHQGEMLAREEVVLSALIHHSQKRV